MIHPSQAEIRHGRWCLVLAAVLWSLSGLGTRLLKNPGPLGLNEPALTPVQIAFFRALFAGLVMLPLVPFRQVAIRPIMPAMIVCFAVMNYLFISAITLGSAANAILLQNTAPFFVFAYSIFVLRERADTKSVIAITLGMLGMAVIVGGDGKLFDDGRFDVTLMAVGSGITYAGVILCLRHLRDQPSAWLSVQNNLGSAVCMSLAIMALHGIGFWIDWITTPTLRQIGFLMIFGGVQMALPYFLFARGLRFVNPQEAGAITLLEPLLNPVWAYLVSPETDTPTRSTWAGGALIIGALAYRYWPRPAKIKIQD
ncbi:DMT family transporter [Zavarzinella formosa]|uniref:DMT family transporter n=1 Tax=Zavarzinella formosa TaxID=360055 RepID=UPI00030C4558|nr:EamA family transporter [Zavarzinella formosa]